jgi:2-polyprenyl-3-methyl-5-hydroxy-6-metoxy-1,4-benzoquinol methylase
VKRFVLIAGTINHHPDTEDTRYVHLDASERLIHDAELDIFVQPDVVANLSDELPMFRDSMFDEVICDHVFEHIPGEKLPVVLLAIHRVLKPGGRLIVETPNMTGIAQAWVNGDYSEEELQQWIHGEDIGGAFDGHRHSYSPRSLKRRLVKGNFKVISETDKGLAIRFIAEPVR